MKKIFKIYFKNLKNIIINPAAIVIILGLSIIPSCYTWITLKANWNPYVDTGNVPVAVVNDDKGAIVNNQIINFGDQIVNQLQTNTSMKWTFVGNKVAEEGLKSGTYYAMIEIPENFSEDLKTVGTPTPVRPNLIYKVNEKTNAIAAKITDLAAAQLEEQIKESFIKSVNTSLMKQANHLGSKINENEPMILGLKGVLNSTNSNIIKIQNNIENTSGNLTSLTNYLSDLKGNMSSLTNEISQLNNVVKSSSTLLNITKNNIDTAGGNINNNISMINSTNAEVNNYLNSLKNINAAVNNKETWDTLIDNTLKANNQIYNLILKNQNTLNGLSALDSTGLLNNMGSILDGVKDLITNENNKLNDLKSLVDSGAPKASIDNAVDSIINTNNQANNKINNFNSTFTQSGINTINNLSSNIGVGLSNISNVLASSNAMIPQLKAIESLGINAGNLTASKANELNSKLTNLKSTINDLQGKTEKLNSASLNNLVSVLDKNPAKLANFLSSPVSIKVEDLYGMSIFGVGLAPFYTVLSIWVGALLCTSLLTTNDEEEEDGKKRTLLQIHFGKMLLFLTINLVQTTIVTIGDVLVIGVKPANFWLLMFFAWLSAFVFTAIIFTCVSLMGNFGKAAGLVIMVIQVAGSGAIYPIQVNPEIFQKLYYFWPFTYAIDGFRQAIGGPDWTAVRQDIIVLLIFLVIFLLLAVSKMQVHKITQKTEHLFKESGL